MKTRKELIKGLIDVYQAGAAALEAGNAKLVQLRDAETDPASWAQIDALIIERYRQIVADLREVERLQQRLIYLDEPQPIRKEPYVPTGSRHAATLKSPTAPASDDDEFL